MRRSSKNASVNSVNLDLTGGLNYSTSPANIADSELRRAINFIYDPNTEKLTVRPGTSCKTATALADPILKGYYYVKDSSTAYHVCVSGGKLYYLSGAGLNAWTEIGSLADSTTVPSFITFNSKLLIADGGADIKTWDGTTFGSIASSPQATCLAVIKNRVVANATNEPDSVYLSAPNDAESGDAWDTTKTAIGLKAGYGDLLSVNAFGVFGDDLVISKISDQTKKMYRVNVADATPANWYTQIMSENNASQSSQTMLGAWNNVYFIDSNGFKSIKGVIQYGDLQVDGVGRKVNSVFATSYVSDGIAYVPSYNAIWFNIGERIYCYTERYSASAGTAIPAFTDIEFQWGRCTSIYEANDIVYLTGYNGYLYKLDESLSTDETVPGTTKSYVAAVRTKTFTSPADYLLRKAQIYLTPRSEGAANLYICEAENKKTLLKQITLQTEGEYLYDATGDLYDATGYLWDTGTSPWAETTRSRFRAYEMAFELEVSSGRTGIEWVRAEIATLEGGE